MSEDTQIPENEIRLKAKAYKLRCLDCEKKTSSKGNPMLTQKFEIIESAPITQDGQEIDINGISLLNFMVLTTRNLGNVNMQRNALGLPGLKENEMDNINPLDYKGAEGFAFCASESEGMVDDVTKEPVMNPYTNKQEINWRKNITKWVVKPKGY